MQNIKGFFRFLEPSKEMTFSFARGAREENDVSRILGPILVWCSFLLFGTFVFFKKTSFLCILGGCLVVGNFRAEGRSSEDLPMSYSSADLSMSYRSCVTGHRPLRIIIFLLLRLCENLCWDFGVLPHRCRPE